MTLTRRWHSNITHQLLSYRYHLLLTAGHSINQILPGLVGVIGQPVCDESYQTTGRVWIIGFDGSNRLSLFQTRSKCLPLGWRELVFGEEICCIVGIQVNCRMKTDTLSSCLCMRCMILVTHCWRQLITLMHWVGCNLVCMYKNINQTLTIPFLSLTTLI